MEGIVFGVSKLNFQTIEELENRTPNCMQNCFDEPANMMASTPEILGEKMVETLGLQYLANKQTSSNDDDWQSEEDEIDVGFRKSTRGCTFAERRQLPSRASKESSLLSIKRRTIMKPAKHTSSIHKDFNNLKPSEIKKIYMNKKLTNFRPTSLETIFEEPANNQAIGVRKLRRTLACTDGFLFNNNKALVKKRRAKIKKTFGRRLALKKITLEDFLEKLNSSMEDATNTIKEGDEVGAATFDNTTTEAVVQMPVISNPSENIDDSSCTTTIQTTTDSQLTCSPRTTTKAFINVPPCDTMDEDCYGSPTPTTLTMPEIKYSNSPSVIRSFSQATSL